MKITSLRVRVLKNSPNKLKGHAAITLDNMIAIQDIKILKNGDNMFLAMPSKATKQGGFKDCVHPINADVRAALERILFAGYEFCVEHNYINTQFDVAEGSSNSLLEQTIADFSLASSKEPDADNAPDVDDNTDAPQTNETEATDSTDTNDKPKKIGSLFGWLKN